MRAAVLLLVLAACERDPAEELCPPLSAGDLVITEIRGPQTPADIVTGPWLELYNASGHVVDLLGIRVRFHDAQNNEDVVLVRRSIAMQAGSYAVLGMADDRALPPKVDYGFVLDFHDNPFPDGLTGVDVNSCDTLVDKISYDGLPSKGSYSLGGPPSADANDTKSPWCTDSMSAGTPQAPNIQCP